MLKADEEKNSYFSCGEVGINGSYESAVCSQLVNWVASLLASQSPLGAIEHRFFPHPFANYHLEEFGGSTINVTFGV